MKLETGPIKRAIPCSLDRRTAPSLRLLDASSCPRYHSLRRTHTVHAGITHRTASGTPLVIPWGVSICNPRGYVRMRNHRLSRETTVPPRAPILVPDAPRAPIALAAPAAASALLAVLLICLKASRPHHPGVSGNGKTLESFCRGCFYNPPSRSTWLIVRLSSSKPSRCSITRSYL